MSVGAFPAQQTVVKPSSATAITPNLSGSGVTTATTSSSPVTVTLPANAPVGFQFAVTQLGTGQVTFSPASGASLRHPLGATKIAGRYGTATLVVGSNSNGASAEWVLSGYVS